MPKAMSGEWTRGFSRDHKNGATHFGGRTSERRTRAFRDGRPIKLRLLNNLQSCGSLLFNESCVRDINLCENVDHETSRLCGSVPPLQHAESQCDLAVNAKTVLSRSISSNRSSMVTCHLEETQSGPSSLNLIHRKTKQYFKKYPCVTSLLVIRTQSSFRHRLQVCEASREVRP